MQWISSLLITRLASPLCVYPCGRIIAGEEAYKKRLATKGFQTILDLCQNTFRDVVGEDHLAIGLFGGHGGVVGNGEGLSKTGKRGFKGSFDYFTRFPTRRTRRLLVCVILKLPFVKVPRSAWCYNFFSAPPMPAANQRIGQLAS